MNKRKMGKCGVEVSPLGYGMMRLPMLDGTAGNFDRDGRQIDVDKSISLVRYAIDHGVNYIDTAYNYLGGYSERVTGLALQDGYRDKVFLATKSPTYLYQSEDDFDTFLNTQLERLQTDHIDFYLLHTLSRENWDKVLKYNAIEKLRKAKQEGKVRFIGFSFHDDFPVFKEIVDYMADEWDFCQIQLNYLDMNEQAGYQGLQYAAKHNLGVIIMEPLRGGLLASLPKKAEDLFLAKEKQPVEAALQFLWSMPEVGTILSGMNSLDQVVSNLSYAENIPDQYFIKEKPLFDQAKALIEQYALIGCTGCKYCADCPSDIKISELFALYNQFCKDNDKAKTQALYSTFEKNAHHCIGCKKCERLCPQHLPITALLPKIDKMITE
ncbi:MAG: aldo/keto reductase [Clostridiales bacterium]|nr:aldo/keto reductase [Clostridiales bacterium]